MTAQAGPCAGLQWLAHCTVPCFWAALQVKNLKATGAVNLGPTTVAGTTSIAKATYANAAIKAAGVTGELCTNLQWLDCAGVETLGQCCR